MAKKESTLINMVLTLVIITILASTALAFVYQITKGPKQQADDAKKNFAIKKVTPEFDNEPGKECYRIASFDGGDSLTCYPAKKNGQLVGVAIETYTMNGFSGLIRLMVGLDTTGNIVTTSVLEQKETPGLGTKMVEPFFKDQFNGKNPATANLTVKKDGGEIDAITASTITSRAYCDAVNRAHKSFIEGGKNE